MSQITNITDRIVEIAGETVKTIAVGRSGEASAKRCELEIQRFAGNKPYLCRVTGVKFANERDEYVLDETRLAYAGRRLSGGANGECWYDLDIEGVYAAHGVLFSGSRISTVYFYHTVAGVIPLSKDEAFKVARVMFPDQFRMADAANNAMAAAKKRAGEIISEIRAERDEFEAVVIDGIEAVPDFDDISEGDLRVKIAQGDFDAEPFINNSAAPAHYVVTEPVFAKALTAEKAVEQAKTKIEEARQREAARDAAADKARQAAKESGLPQLTGTDRQIRWAEQIRAQAAKKDPKAAELKRWKKASRWIEARSRWTRV